MKKTIITLTLAALLPLSVSSHTNDGLSAMSFDQYIDYSTMSHDIPVRLQAINEIIRASGGTDRTIELAKQGQDKPSFAIGSLHLYGHVFEKDIDKAIELLTRGSENGPYSQFELGMYYVDFDNRYGHDLVSKTQGAKLIYQAAEKGLEEAQYIAAKLLIEGQYIVEDRDMALVFLNSAASSSYVPAIKMLQSINELHTEFREDFDKVQRRAAEGHLPSLVRLAQFYHHGWRVTSDKQKAKRLLEYAAINGSEKAAMLLTTLSFDN